jgi:hypothetical protein
MFRISKRLIILATASLAANVTTLLAQDKSLPNREGVRPETTKDVPHIHSYKSSS